MSNILFITSAIVYDTDANGICTYNLARECVKHGHNVYCIAKKTDNSPNTEHIEGMRIYRLPAPWFSFFLKRFGNSKGFLKVIFKTIHILRNVCLIPFYPNVSPARSRKVFKIACDIIEKNDIDIVVGAFRPYESIYTVNRLKKKYRERIKCVSLYLDLLWQKKKIRGFKFLYDHKSKVAQRKDLQNLDRVLIPISAKGSFSETYGVQSNVDYFDFPLYVKDSADKKCDFEFDTEFINLAYVGSLDMNNRNPEKLIEKLRSVKASGVKVKLHIWGGLSGVEEIIDANSDIVKYHGLIDYAYVHSLLSKADFLVNIGNRVTYDMVPSKIFQLFATGKPIVNFISHKSDISVPYFERYPSVCNVRMYLDDESTEDLHSFLTKNEHLMFDVDDLFIQNTPSYLADKIEKVLN